MGNRKLLSVICDLLNTDKPDNLLKCSIRKAKVYLPSIHFDFTHELVLWVADIKKSVKFLDGYTYPGNNLVVTIGGYTLYAPFVIRQGTKSMFEKWEKENNNG